MFAALHQQTQARSPRDHQHSSQSTTAAPFHLIRDGHTGKLDQKPQELPPHLDKRRRLGKKLQQDLSSLPGSLQGHLLRSLRPHPRLVPPVSSAPTEEWGAAVACFYFSSVCSCYPAHLRPVVCKPFCRKSHLGKMFMEHMRGRGLLRKWLHCVDGKEGRKP